jgi:hypothetical protein
MRLHVQQKLGKEAVILGGIRNAAACLGEVNWKMKMWFEAE